MKTITRIRRNNGTNRHLPQAQPHPDGASAQLKTPQLERQVKTEDWHLPAAPRPSAELEAALEELKRAGREAGAFLVLVADHIRSEAKTNDGWQPMQIPQFGEGIMDLAHGLISDFWSNLEKFIASETGEKLEAATGALGHGLRMMADIYSERGLSGGFAFYTGIRLNEKLHTAFDRAFKASCEARKAVAS